MAAESYGSSIVSVRKPPTSGTRSWTSPVTFSATSSETAAAAFARNNLSTRERRKRPPASASASVGAPDRISRASQPFIRSRTAALSASDLISLAFQAWTRRIFLTASMCRNLSSIAFSSFESVQKISPAAMRRDQPWPRNSPAAVFASPRPSLRRLSIQAAIWSLSARPSASVAFRRARRAGASETRSSARSLTAGEAGHWPSTERSRFWRAASSPSGSRRTGSRRDRSQRSQLAIFIAIVKRPFSSDVAFETAAHVSIGLSIETVASLRGSWVVDVEFGRCDARRARVPSMRPFRLPRRIATRERRRPGFSITRWAGAVLSRVSVAVRLPPRSPVP